MFNVGVVVKECVLTCGACGRVVVLRFSGYSRFGAYCSRERARCLLDCQEYYLITG
jgi:raffinose synthase